MEKSKYSQLVEAEKLKRKPSWFMNILISIDQLGNAIAGGNPDSTISARIGYFVSCCFGFVKRYWKFMETIVNFTFLPVDGIEHCKEAYLSDQDEEFNEGNMLSKIVLAIITIPICGVLIIIIRLIVFIYPKIKCKYYLNGEKVSLDKVNELRR